jgi:predicted nuclease of restriction endonuclease-like (RecB) superfamily
MFEELMNKIPNNELPAYKDFLEKAKTQIYATRVRAATAVNRELIALYWWVGEHIVKSQEKYGWGRSVVERLSQDLKAEFSHKTGFSPQNLWYMRQLSEQTNSPTACWRNSMGTKSVNS